VLNSTPNGRNASFQIAPLPHDAFRKGHDGLQEALLERIALGPSSNRPERLARVATLNDFLTVLRDTQQRIVRLLLMSSDVDVKGNRSDTRHAYCRAVRDGLAGRFLLWQAGANGARTRGFEREARRDCWWRFRRPELRS
jgi:hypothetical protein